VKGWKWPSRMEFQIGIIALLVLIICIMLQHPARWG
jgi:glucose uptake protein GlcU